MADKMRELVEPEVAYIRDDGHNYPTVFIFRCVEHAAEHIGVEYDELEEMGYATDANGDSWMLFSGGLPVIDLTVDAEEKSGG